MIDYEKYGFYFKYNTWHLEVGDRRWINCWDNCNVAYEYWIGRGPLEKHKFNSVEEFEAILEYYRNPNRILRAMPGFNG